MEDSILNSTKSILGVDPTYSAFDIDIITHINAAFSVVNQLGVGPDVGFMVNDETAMWADLSLPMNQLNLLRSYIFLKTRMMFDPPASGFLLDATNKQIQEFEVRLSYLREATIPVPTIPTDTYGSDQGYEDGYLTGMTDAIQDLTGS